MKQKSMAVQSQQEAIRREDFFLVQQAICGDQSAYTRLYSRYFPKLFRQVKPIVGVVEAEDVAMKVIERAFERLHEFKPDRPLGAWLSRMANNLAIDFVRSQKRRRTSSIDDDGVDDEGFCPLQVSDPNPVPDEVIIEDQTRRIIGSVARGISPTHELVLKLKYVNNLTIEEVADALGYSPDSVRKCLHTIRKRLRATEI